MKRTLTVLSMAGMLLAGCADMKGIGPSAKLQEANDLGLPTTASADAQVLGPSIDWWTSFGDPQLDHLVAQALTGNPSLRMAAARVAKAQAGVELARSADWPQVNGQLDLNRQKFSSNHIYPAPLGGSIVNMGNLQVGGSWELDFFGKNSGHLHAALGQARAAEAERDAARVLLASNVVRAYLQWARLLEQRQVAERMLAQRQQMLSLVEQRVKAGLDNLLEVRLNETGRADTRTSIAALNQQIDASRNALAALMGQPRLPEGVAEPKLSRLKPMAIPLELSADWLGRRADIVAARWRVESARGDAQVARAQFFPNINLAGFVGFQSLGFDNMLKSGSMQWGVGPAIRLPIFEGGRLRAQLRSKSADVDAAIESYNATVIDAMREVADQLQAVSAVSMQQREQGAALRAAEGAYDIAQQRYTAELATYLHVLSAETAVLAQRRQQVDLAAKALFAQVGLAQAMGGGWQPSPEQAVVHSTNLN